MSNRQYDIVTASETTVEWLMKDSNYIRWRDSHSGLLWIRGKPGSGKSTLMKFVLSREDITEEGGKSVVAAFFFNARGMQLQHTPLGLFRVLLFQLMTQVTRLQAKFLEYCERKSIAQGGRKEKLEWHENELRDMVSAYIQQALRWTDVKIFVDALDECGGSSAIDLASYFKQLISNCSSKGRIHVCISCRHYPIINTLVDLKVTVEEKNTLAITDYVEGSLNLSMSAVARELDDMRKIEREILERASGVFQWVAFVLRMVISLMKDGYHPRSVRKRMRELPTDLDDLYAHILQQVRGKHQARTLSLIRWIYCARRPLSLSEMRVAMAFDTEPPYESFESWKELDDYVESDEQMSLLVTSLSGGLAEVIDHNSGFGWRTESSRGPYGIQSTPYIQFIHESVNDYLGSKGLAALDGPSILPIVGRSHYRIAKSIINYLRTKEVLHIARHLTGKSGKATVRSIDKLVFTPFMLYSLEFWFTHLRRAEKEHCLQDDLLNSFITPRNKPSGPTFNFPTLSHHFLGGAQMSLLHHLVRHDIKSVVIALLELPETEINLKDSNDDTPLIVAIKYRRKSLSRRFLKIDEVDVNLKDAGGRTALIHALLKEDDELVLLLLGRDDIDVTSKDYVGYTALNHAITRVRQGTVQHLLAHDDIRVSAKDAQEETTLDHSQGVRAPRAMIYAFLRKALDVQAPSGYFGDALLAAVRFERKDVVHLILESFAHLLPNDDEYFQMDLQKALNRGHGEIVKLVLEARIGPGSPDSSLPCLDPSSTSTARFERFSPISKGPTSLFLPQPIRLPYQRWDGQGQERMV